MKTDLVQMNSRDARRIWGHLPKSTVQRLRNLTTEYCLAISSGDLQLLDGGWYVTHSGLLRISAQRRCAGIRTVIEKNMCDPSAGHWVFRAVVFKTPGSKGFVGYGDANPANVSPMVRGAEMRIAETRAVNRALRKAYGIGLCSVEELGWAPKRPESTSSDRVQPISKNGNGHHPNPPRLRDQLCLLIRQYELDPNLVKAYAAHFCGTERIKDASRDLVESFISHLAASAKEDRDGLICKLNSFAPLEVQQ